MAAETLTFESVVSVVGEKLSPTGQITATGNALDKITAALTSLQTNLQITMSFEFAKLAAFVLWSTVGGTLKTNATDASGGNTVTFYANELFYWHGTYGTNPFASNNVTTAYLNNTDAAAGSVKIWVLRNPLT